MRYKTILFSLVFLMIVLGISDPAFSIRYNVYDEWGGTFYDAEKSPTNTEDDLMCWAAAASNVLTWTGWGFPTGAAEIILDLDDEDEIFEYFQDHWTDKGSLAVYAWDWWFDGTNDGPDESNWAQVDVAGGGFWGDRSFGDYYHEQTDDARALEAIEDFLDNGYGTTLGIRGGGDHAITVWGYEYDGFGNYLGIYVTDSDDDKNLNSPPDSLAYYAVASTDGRWHLQGYSGGNDWYIDEVQALEPYETNRINASAGSGGSISPAGSVRVNWRAQQTFTITPDPGYRIARILINRGAGGADAHIDWGDVGADTTCTFRNVTRNHTIEAIFEEDTFSIGATALFGGSISPAGTVHVPRGGDQTFTITPDPGFRITDVLIYNVYDGWSSVGDVPTYTFTNVTRSYGIEAHFDPIDSTRYTITALFPYGGYGGRISPAAPQSVYHGTNKTYTINPDDEFEVADVLIDGVSIGPRETYTFYNVTSDHTIEARFELRTYRIYTFAGSGGRILPEEPVEVESGADQELRIVPDLGYQITDVIVEGTSVGPRNRHMFHNVTRNYHITAYFEPLTFETTATCSFIDASTNSGGFISPAGPIIAEKGSSQTFTITAWPGYRIANVLVDEVPKGPIPTYTFKYSAARHRIEVEFTPIATLHQIWANVGVGGSISPAGTAGIKQGANQTFTITPEQGYRIADILVDGYSIPGIAPYGTTYTLENVHANHWIEVSFEQDIWGQGGQFTLGGGSYWSVYNPFDYYWAWSSPLSQQGDPSELMAMIGDYLHSGYGVAMDIYAGNERQTLRGWGYEYDNVGNYTGLWVTDPDDYASGLRLLSLQFDPNQGLWYLDSDDLYGYQGWFIGGVQAIAESAVPEPGTFFLVGIGLAGLLALRHKRRAR